MNRIDQLIQEKEDILSVYFTAGFPSLHDTLPILQHLEMAGVDLIELGIPFSDPLADGPTIQQSNQKALKNGMTMDLLFSQLRDLRKHVNLPIILMGYLNPILQYGEDRFIQKCQELGIDGVILPDLPMDYYQSQLETKFKAIDLKNIMLVTPSSSDDRIRSIDNCSTGFIYAVSTHSITGSKLANLNESYFDRLKALNLTNQHLIGFGIHDSKTFVNACSHAKGGIIGSAFIKHLAQHGTSAVSIQQFVNTIRP
jgi:tryptophan synthase alpha chain